MTHTLKQGTIVKIEGFPIRILETVEVESKTLDHLFPKGGRDINEDDIGKRYDGGEKCSPNPKVE